MNTNRSARRRHGRRGTSLLQMIMASAIFGLIVAGSLGMYVGSVKGFFRENSETYTQTNARRVVDQMSRDTRAARLVLPFAWKTWDWSQNFYQSCSTRTLVQNLYNNTYLDACVILEVPSHDANGIFYRQNAKANNGLFASASSQRLACIVNNPSGGVVLPTTGAAFMATDTVIYYWNDADNTLRRTCWPSTNVLGTDGATHSSTRAAEDSKVLAYDVTSFHPVFRDQTGAICTPGAKTAQLDIALTVSQTTTGTSQAAISTSGVRVRNMHSGSIKGVLNGGFQNQDYYVEAVAQSGSFAAGTVVGTAWTDQTSGAFEVSGLPNGTYKLRITPPTNNPSGPSPASSGTRYAPTVYTVANETTTTLQQTLAWSACS